jgi:type IV pilus assembly protein PilZ
LTCAAIRGYDAIMSAKDARGTTDADERRRAPRVFVDLEVDYALEDNYLFAYITDISATGIFIRTVAPEPAGTHLNLRFTPPPADGAAAPDRAFELDGEVIWVNPYRPGAPDSTHPGMGVRFLGLDDDDRRRLIVLVRRIAYLT